MTEAQLQSQIRESEAQLRQLKVETARYRVALRRGLSEAQARRLIGEDEDSFDEDAKALLSAPPLDELRRMATLAAAKTQWDGESGVRPKLRSGSVSPMALNGDPLLQSVKRKLGIR